MKTYIGIDNGVSGSIGVINVVKNVFQKTPVISELDYTKEKKKVTRLNFSELFSLLSVYNKENVLVALERPMVFPGRWVATLSAIRCHEATLVTLNCLEFPYIFIDSKEWQKELLPKNCSKEELKEASLDIGNKLFPEFRDVKHPDRDAILIAEYCKRKGL